MSRTRESLLWQHIESARWYAGKGRDAELVAVHPLPWLAPATPEFAVRLEVAEVHNLDGIGETHHYLLALSRRAVGDSGPGLIGLCYEPELGEVSLHDATRDQRALSLLLTTQLKGAQAVEGDASLTARLIEGGTLDTGLAPRMFSGEQSNTSVMYGDAAMLKLFRRLEIGRNLDIEVHAALADGPAAAEVAKLFGWLEIGWLDSEGRACRADAGMLVEQLSAVSDGWQIAVDHASTGRDFTAEASALGEALRLVHRGLAAAFGQGRRSGAESSAAMSDRLDAAITTVPFLAEHRAGLQQLFDTLAGRDLHTQRVHGDFHLGQTLREPTGRWRIIDFEGEPLKTLAERGEPDTVWRDVAGMLRSLDYAGGFAVRNSGLTAEVARDWVAAGTRAFLTGYAGAPLDPDQHRLVDAYLGDKAVYEVLYEARNRPDWMGIPLAALGELTDSEPTDDSLEASR